MGKVCYVDGGCRHQGKADKSTWEGYGSYKIGDAPIVTLEFGRTITNNEAEYLALEHLLLALAKTNELNTTIFTDSRLLVGQIQEGWRIRARHLKASNDWAKYFCGILRATLVWVPRKKIVEVLGH